VNAEQPSVSSDWAPGHRVTWETSPRREALHASPAGLEVTLLGRDPGGHFPDGCEGCTLVWKRLHAIALRALAEAGIAAFEIDPFDASVHLRPESAWTPEVQLTAVLHGEEGRRRGLPDKAVVAKLESRLEAIGVQRNRWRER